MNVSPSNHETRVPFLPREDKGAKIVYGILRVLAATCVVLIGIYIVALNTTPRIATPKRPAVPKQNGFPMRKAATANLIHDKEVGDAIARKPKKQWTLAEKRALVNDNRVAIAQTREALRYPYYEENTMVSLDAQFPYYAKFRGMTRTLVLAGNVAWEDGKPMEAVDYYLHGVTIGRRVPHRSGVLTSLVGIACEVVARRPIWNHLEKMDKNTATHTLARLEALRTERLPYSETLEEEKYTMLRMMRDVMEHPEKISPAADKADKGMLVIKMYRTVVPRKHVADSIDSYMTQVIAQSKKPYITDHGELPLPNEIITKIMVPELVPARCKYVVNETADSLLRTTLALRIYQLQQEKYPAKLSDLVAAKIIKQVPDDPFALPGTPLQYKRQSGGKYLLYSVGPDGIDDAGKGITGKSSTGATDRTVRETSKGDMVSGWYGY